MSKRKFSKKEVAISIAAAALAIATVGGAVAIHKDSSNSNTGHSITVEQSDYSKKKEEAIQQIQDTVKDLSDDQQSEIDSYIKQNIENIQKAESERTIESTLQETLDYIDQRSLSEKEEQRKETQTTETLNQMTDSIRRELRAIQSSREDSETENVISEYLSIQSAFANAAVPIEMEGKFENRLDEIEENYPIEELIHQKESNSKKEKQLQKEIKNLQQASRRLSKLKKIQKR